MPTSDSSSSDSEGIADESVKKYKKALRAQEAENNRLRMLVATEQRRMANLTNCERRALTATEHSEHASDKQMKQPKHIYIQDLKARLDIQESTRQFTYMYAFWIRPTDMRIFKLEPDVRYDPEARFLSIPEDLEQQGLLFDLRAVIPAKYHSKLSTNPYIKQINHEMHQQRSNACTRLHQAGAFILDCSNDIYHDKDRRVAKFKEDIGFTGVIDGKDIYETLAPILFRVDPEQMDKKWTIFRHPILMRTYSALVRGVASIRGLSEGQVTKKDSHSTLESIWKIKRITPGAIALAATLARFVASADRSLLARGADTGINYQNDYEYYFKYLHMGLHKKKPSVIDIFQMWDNIFYPDIPENPGAPPAKDAADRSALLDEMVAEVEVAGSARPFNDSGATAGSLLPQAEPSAPTSHLEEDAAGETGAEPSAPFSLEEDAAGDTGAFATHSTADRPTREESEQDELNTPIKTPNRSTTSKCASVATAPPRVSVVAFCRRVKLTQTKPTQTTSNRSHLRSTSPLTDVEQTMDTSHQVTPRTMPNQQRRSAQKRKVVQSDIETDENQPPVQSSKRARRSGRTKKK